MTAEERIDRALALLKRDAPRQEPQQRDWYQRVQSRSPETIYERDWTGSSWSGQSASGRSWSGGREI